MAKIFRYSEYDKNVEKLVNAIHSWLIHTKSVNLKKDFQLKYEQPEWLDGHIGVDKYGRRNL